jgi:hypothetical protein
VWHQRLTSTLLLLLNLSLPFCNLPSLQALAISCARQRAPPRRFVMQAASLLVSSSCICTVAASQAPHTRFFTELEAPYTLLPTASSLPFLFKTTKTSHSFLPATLFQTKDFLHPSKSWTFPEHATSDINSVLRYRCIVREQGFGVSSSICIFST